MDVELLSKMISELIVDHDMVGLPGVGTFYAEVVPSTFSDKGYTVNPPYRRLSFLPDSRENDLLANFYASVNNIPADLSLEYLRQFLAELAEVLKERKIIVLPGLGRLRATKENNFFFVPDENLDIYPDAFGLSPVSLKSLPAFEDEKVEIPFEFKARRPSRTDVPETSSSAPEPETSAPAAEPETAAAEAEPETATSGTETETALAAEPETAGESDGAEPAPAAAAEPESAEPAVSEQSLAESEPTLEPETAEEEQPAGERKFRWWILLTAIAALAIVALVSFLILARVAPDFIDSILYTPEELRIINY